MKTNALKTVLITVFFVLFSCQETVVTNIVHPDGSVTRRIVIKNPDGEEDRKPENSRVPYDSTWTISDTFEIGDNCDTTWIRIAEKHFRNVAEINKEYTNDKGPNRNFTREAGFDKKFKWFSTLITFSENIDKTLHYGYPIEQYLTREELDYYYIPDNVLYDRLAGSDSTTVKLMVDSVKNKSDKWMLMCLISEWKEEFLVLSAKREKRDVNKEFLKDKDSTFYKLLEENEKDTTKADFDTVIVAIMKDVFGEEMYFQNKTDIDSSVKIVTERFQVASAFEGYSVKNLMPGKMVGTNGYIDQKGEIQWAVNMEFFLTEPYQMWAESKITNIWAWVVSGIFVLFVMLGLIVRLKSPRKP